MNDLIYLGKIVNTHGIKGEIRIISDFKYKSEVFKANGIIYINNTKYIIKSYRHHKIYDMVTLYDINSIGDALNIKGYDMYINRDDYKFSGILYEDIIGLDVYDNDTYKGKVSEVLNTKKYDLLVIDGLKKHMIPNISEFIKNIDLENKRINVNYIRGLDNED